MADDLIELAREGKLTFTWRAVGDANRAGDEFTTSRNCVSGKEIQIRRRNKGKPWLDPAYEHYHCM